MPSPFACVEPRALRARLEQFADIDPDQLIRCAEVSPRVAQLATTFPLLFVMLATGSGPVEARAAALRLIDDGRPLRDIAARLSVLHALRSCR